MAPGVQGWKWPGPRAPWKGWDCCLWVPGHHGPLPVHGLSVGSPSPCWEPVLGSHCTGRWEQRPPTGQSPLGRGLEETGLSGCPGLLDGGGEAQVAPPSWLRGTRGPASYSARPTAPATCLPEAAWPPGRGGQLQWAQESGVARGQRLVPGGGRLSSLGLGHLQPSVTSVGEKSLPWSHGPGAGVPPTCHWSSGTG